MSKIRIKNFGPIKGGYQENDGWMDIKKVTVFIGNQGSGKSTVAKTISTVTWIEKALNRGDFDTFHLTKADFFELFEYQRIQNYFKKDTIIEYVGERVTIRFDNRNAHPEFDIIEGGNYTTPKIMYVPAERNFLSTVDNAFDVKGLPSSLFEFAEEVKKAQFALNDSKLQLPISNLQFRYDKRKDDSYLVGEDYEINLLEASSGYQSLVPLFLVTQFLSKYINRDHNTIRDQLSPSQSVRMDDEITTVRKDPTLSDNQKSKMSKDIEAKYFSKCLFNIVEELEQNLFPDSQKKLLYRLLEFNNIEKSNKLLLTSHSPYIINDLTLAVKANGVKLNVKDETQLNKVNRIVPLKSTIIPSDLIIYEMNEDGTVERLEDYKGLPSDENFLNDDLAEGNESFAQLKEIEKGWR